MSIFGLGDVRFVCGHRSLCPIGNVLLIVCVCDFGGDESFSVNLCVF